MQDYGISADKLKSSAQGAAINRAYAALEPDPAIRNGDSLARLFADKPIEACDVADFRDQLEAMLPGAYFFQNVRTKHIDHLLAKALRDGFKQIVILGAGYDTRAYRFVSPQAHFIEVDLPELQQLKIAKITAHFGVIPAQVSYLGLDFNHQTLKNLSACEHYRPDTPTFFIWEGVSYYLQKEGVHTTLDFIGKQAASGSKIVFDYMPESMIDRSIDYYGGAQSHEFMSSVGEPVVFGIPDNQLAQFLTAHGLKVDSDLNPDALAKAYLEKTDGSQYGQVAGYIRIAQASVA
jgi:methyltransferase (TIGR00027 family)